MLLTLFWEFLKVKWTTFLLILLLLIGCPLIHGYSTNSLLCYNCLNLTAADYLTELLRIFKPTSQLLSYLLILPFSVFPLYAHNHLVKGHFLMLRRQSGTLSLTKSGHPTPSHPSDHHLKLIFFSSPTDCVCVCVRERERERERTSGLSQSVRFFSPLILFHVMDIVLRRRNGTEKNTLVLLLLVGTIRVTSWARCTALPDPGVFNSCLLLTLPDYSNLPVALSENCIPRQQPRC